MPILRLKEIREMSSEERVKRIHELKTELMRLRTTIAAGGTLENPSRIKELRKTIAQLLTVDSEMPHEEVKGEEEKK